MYNTVVYVEKNLRVSGPVWFKPELLKGQLYYQITKRVDSSMAKLVTFSRALLNL